MRFSLAAELPLSFLALCLAVSSTLAAPGVQRRRSDGLHIPLQRRATPSRTSDEWAEWAQREKYRLDAKYGTPSRKRSSGYNLLVNQDADSSYYGSLAVGTPAVAYNVILDTGSADFWLADSTCSSGCSSDLTTFDSSRSSSFSNASATFSVTYGSGSVSGNLATDVVQMAGFQVTEQTFGLADQISSGLIDSPVSGLMGLAWQGLSSFSAKPFWQQLYESNVLDSGVMGFFLTRYINVSSAQTLESGGVFTLGATNTSLYTGEIDYRPLSQDNLYWTIPLSNITIGSSTVTMSSDASAAVIDTGTTLIGGPSSEVAEVYGQISGSSALSGNYDGYYSYPCSTDVSISLSFGGRTWTIASDDFSLFRVDSDTCVGAIFVFSSSSPDPASPFSGSGSSSTISWIFGDTFLKNVYSVFRASPASVGFAQLSDAAIAINGDSSVTVPTPTTGSVSASVTGNTKLNGAARPTMGVALFISSLAIQLLFFV